MTISYPNKADHSSFLSYTPSPLATRSSLIRSSVIVIPWICYSMLKEIETSSIFLGEGVVVYIVLTKVFRANPSPYSRVMSSLYSCLRNEFAAMWLDPIAVAFHPA
jgi:hypothetical protein